MIAFDTKPRMVSESLWNESLDCLPSESHINCDDICEEIYEIFEDEFEHEVRYITKRMSDDRILEYLCAVRTDDFYAKFI